MAMRRLLLSLSERGCLRENRCNGRVALHRKSKLMMPKELSTNDDDV